MEKTNEPKEIILISLMLKEDCSLSKISMILSIRLEKLGIKKSPQVIAKYLKILEKEGKIEETENGKKI